MHVLNICYRPVVLRMKLFGYRNMESVIIHARTFEVRTTLKPTDMANIDRATTRKRDNRDRSYSLPRPPESNSAPSHTPRSFNATRSNSYSERKRLSFSGLANVHPSRQDDFMVEVKEDRFDYLGYGCKELAVTFCLH
jgi:hypothetical protein